jgi:GntR family transcriptional regulator
MRIVSVASGIVLRRSSGLPVYVQIVDQFRFLIATGRYARGELLPPTRELAAELGINFNTVIRAYRELQRDGLVRSTPGKGALVIGTGGQSAAAEVDAILHAALERALASGFTAEELVERVRSILGSLGSREARPSALGIDAGPKWRGELIASQLAAELGLAVVEASTAAAGSRMLTASTAPDADLALVLAHESRRRLVDLAPADVAVVAGDANMADWIGAALAVLNPDVRTVAVLAVPSTLEARLQAGTVAIVEAGLPGPELPGSVRVALVPAPAALEKLRSTFCPSPG